jgi:hypothetical protein
MSSTGADLALYGTIWLSLALFVIGQGGQRAGLRDGRASGAAWWMWCIGVMLCGAHMVLAFGVRHAWSHAAAVRATALQTEAVYGLYWGGGLYVNYLFVAVWFVEAIWWRLNARSFFRRPRAVTQLVRAFYLLILFNAAVVFAAPARRAAGMVFVAALLWAWRPGMKRGAAVVSSG